jgi:hypothetical protein
VLDSITIVIFIASFCPFNFFSFLCFVFYIVAALYWTGYTHGWTWKKDAGKKGKRRIFQTATELANGLFQISGYAALIRPL